MKREDGSNFYKPKNSFKNKYPNILHNIEYIDINHNSAGLINKNLDPKIQLTILMLI